MILNDDITIKEKQDQLYAFCAGQRCQNCIIKHHCARDWFGILRDCKDSINNLYDVLLEFRRKETKINIMYRGEIVGTI